MNFPFSVYGGVISGFQRYDVNNMVAIAHQPRGRGRERRRAAAGYGLITLVAATTSVRFVAYFIYRQNAYRIFPALRIRSSLFRRESPARSHRLQRLLVDHRLGEQAQLRARRARHWRLHGQRSGGGLGAWPTGSSRARSGSRTS